MRTAIPSNDFAKNHPEMNLNQVENYYTLLDGPFYRHMMREFEAISENELKCGDEWTKGTVWPICPPT